MIISVCVIQSYLFSFYCEHRIVFNSGDIYYGEQEEVIVDCYYFILQRKMFTFTRLDS